MFVLAHRMLMNWGKEEAWNAIIREAEIKPKYMFSKAFKAKIEFIDFQFLGLACGSRISRSKSSASSKLCGCHVSLYHSGYT